MKISIELEIQPSEVKLATELLATLRLITEHAAPKSQSGAQPFAAAAPAVQPVVRNVPVLLRGLLEELLDEAKLDSVASSVATILTDPSYGDPAKNAEELQQVFQSFVFSPEFVQEQRRVGPYVQLLTKLPDPYKSSMTSTFISVVLRHLALKRTIGTNRLEFYTHAEAFAVFVALGSVAIDGAVQSIFKLLNKADTRAAAITMLGKTVELCREKLIQCSPQHLESLYKALDKVTEPEFSYDMTWLNSSLNRPAAPAAPAPAGAANGAPMPVPAEAAAAAAAPTPQPMPTPSPPPAQAQPAAAPAAAAAPAGAPVLSGPHAYVLQSASVCHGNTEAVYALAYDSATHGMVAGGKDPYLVCWDAPSGTLTHQVSVTTSFVCGMDIQQHSHTLLMCGANIDEMGMPSPCISAFDGNQGYRSKGILVPAQRTSVSALRALSPDTDCFLTSESLPENMPNHEMVCLYDLGGKTSIQGMNPVQMWTAHTDMVTCFGLHPTNPNVFVSGSKDKTIRVWDKRQPQCVGMFGMQDPNTFEVQAHDEMVTSMDTFDNVLLSASVDYTLCYWDFRSLSSTNSATPAVARMQLDGQPILKVAASGCPYKGVAAISTYQSLYTVDLTNPTSPLVYPASIRHDETRPGSIYHELKWAAGTPYLFASSENPGVEMLHISAVPVPPS